MKLAFSFLVGYLAVGPVSDGRELSDSSGFVCSAECQFAFGGPSRDVYVCCSVPAVSEPISSPVLLLEELYTVGTSRTGRDILLNEQKAIRARRVLQACLRSRISFDASSISQGVSGSDFSATITSKLDFDIIGIDFELQSKFWSKNDRGFHNISILFNEPLKPSVPLQTSLSGGSFGKGFPPKFSVNVVLNDVILSDGSKLIQPLFDVVPLSIVNEEEYHGVFVSLCAIE